MKEEKLKEIVNSVADSLLKEEIDFQLNGVDRDYEYTYAEAVIDALESGNFKSKTKLEIELGILIETNPNEHLSRKGIQKYQGKYYHTELSYADFLKQIG